MINAPPLHATRPLGRALLTLGALAATYYIVWLACLVRRVGQRTRRARRFFFF